MFGGGGEYSTLLLVCGARLLELAPLKISKPWMCKGFKKSSSHTRHVLTFFRMLFIFIFQIVSSSFLFFLGNRFVIHFRSIRFYAAIPCRIQIHLWPNYQLCIVYNALPHDLMIIVITVVIISSFASAVRIPRLKACCRRRNLKTPCGRLHTVPFLSTLELRHLQSPSTMPLMKYGVRDHVTVRRCAQMSA